MKNKIFIFLIMLLCLICYGCTRDNDNPCSNGHDWVEATLEKPKTCTVCDTTEGEKLVENFALLSKALEELKKNNYTCSNIPNHLLIGAGSDVSTPIYLERNNSEMMKTMTINGKIIKIYINIQEDKTFCAGLEEDTNNWEISKFDGDCIVSFNPIFFTNIAPIFIPTEDMFTYSDGVWVGDVTKIVSSFSELFEIYIENEIEIREYNIKLNTNGQVNRIYFSFGVSVETINNEYIYSNIGTTTIKDKPKFTESFEELTKALTDLNNNNYTVSNEIDDKTITIQMNSNSYWVTYYYITFFDAQEVETTLMQYF